MTHESADRQESTAAPWKQGWDHDHPLFAGLPAPTHSVQELRTMTYEVTDRIARITFNRPEHGNAITADTPLELARCVEWADLDPRVHVILVSGRGKGFCGGYDLSLYAEGADAERPDSKRDGTVLDPRVQTRNHVPGDTWDPAVDYMMMSRFNRGFASLMRADKPTVAKLHGFCVAGGTDIALHADQIITATDTKIGYPPTRVWGVPSTGLWAHRLGDQRAKRLLLTGDCITGAQAADWGLAAEAVDPAHLDEATESLCGRIAALPINQLVMTKLALNTALNSQAIANSAAISTLADGASRHTREGYSFATRAATAGFRTAVRERDEPFGDAKVPTAGNDSAATPSTSE